MPEEDQDQLYVRVEGYKVLLQDLEAIRQIIDNIREASEVLEQVRNVKAKSIDTIYENIDRLNGKLEDLEMEMPEIDDPPQVSIDRPEQEPRIDDSVNELHSELENLQEELSQLGGERSSGNENDARGEI